MLITRSRATRLVSVAFAATTLGVPAAAFAAPSVIRIDPATHAQTVIASGAPLSQPSGIAIDASGTIFVANSAKHGAGLYSLTAPQFAITPLVSDDGFGHLVAGGSTLYSLGSPAVRSVGTTPPFAQQVVTSRGLYDESAVGPMFGALSGTTLYTTTYAACESAEGGPGEVVAVDTATGQQTEVKSFTCAGLAGIALAPDGTLLVAESAYGKTAARIARLNPANGAVSTVSSGGSLKDPRGVALAASGALIVADATSGVLAVSTSDGAQSTIASGPRLSGADSVALDAGGTIYVTADGAPVLKLSAVSRRFSSKGFRFKASCTLGCDFFEYDVTVQAKGVYPFSVSGEGPRGTLKVKFPKSVNRDIARALARHRSVRMRVTARPQDVDGVALGKSTSLTVRIT